MKTFNILAVATVIGAMTSSSIALAAKPAKTPQQQALASLTRTASAIVLAQEGPAGQDGRSGSGRRSRIAHGDHQGLLERHPCRPARRDLPTAQSGIEA